MKVVNICRETIPEFKRREWQVIPVPGYPDCFVLEETGTGKVLGRFMLAEGSDPTILNLIAAAPDLQDIAEMFRDSMIGNKAQKTMVFSLVMKVLQRAAQPYQVEELECV